MRRTKPASIGEIINDFLKESPHISRMLAEARATDVWKEVVGEQIASFTTRISINKGTMFVYFESAIIRHEVFMRRSEIMKELNQKLGEEVIKVIILK